MQFSFRMPVAVQILLCIAKFDGVFKTTSTFLASSVQVNPVIIRKTLGQLKAAGLVEVAAADPSDCRRDPVPVRKIKMPPRFLFAAEVFS